MNDTDKLNAYKKDMQQLLRVFSHDLRNPLVNLRALLNDAKGSLDEAIHDQHGNALTESLPETLDLCGESIDRMNHMIIGINEIYHAMYDELQCEVVDMQALFERELRKVSADNQNIEIKINTLPSLWADPLAMSRIVAELLANAIKALAEDGGSIVVGAEKRNGMDVLWLRDSGCGLAEGDVERVFEAFFTGYGQSEGRGIGLAIVKALVQVHGGNVWCESKHDVGTIFYISMPRKLS